MRGRQYKKRLVVLAVIISLALASIGGVFAPLAVATGKEIGPNEVQGKVLSVQGHGFGRGTIEVKSDQTGKAYTFYVGRNTAYYPRRYPTSGETIRVLYIDDRGYLKATRVEIVTSVP
jgi:hypothetical protein